MQRPSDIIERYLGRTGTMVLGYAILVFFILLIIAVVSPSFQPKPADNNPNGASKSK